MVHLGFFFPDFVIFLLLDLGVLFSPVIEASSSLSCLKCGRTWFPPFFAARISSSGLSSGTNPPNDQRRIHGVRTRTRLLSTSLREPIFLPYFSPPPPSLPLSLSSSHSRLFIFPLTLPSTTSHPPPPPPFFSPPSPHPPPSPTPLPHPNSLLHLTASRSPPYTPFAHSMCVPCPTLPPFSPSPYSPSPAPLLPPRPSPFPPSSPTPLTPSSPPSHFSPIPIPLP